MAETMQLNSLAAAPGARTRAKRVGRGIGSGHGKTCGRGHKGYGARSGSGIKRGFEGGQMPLQRRLPKFGFRSRVALTTEQLPLHVLTRFDGQQVDIATLRQAGLIRKSTSRVKIYLKGELTVKVQLAGIRASKGARAAIEKAGGSIAAMPETPKGKLVAKKPASDGAAGQANQQEQKRPTTTKADTAPKTEATKAATQQKDIAAAKPEAVAEQKNQTEDGAAADAKDDSLQAEKKQ